jgi:hypothetical protein
MSTIYSCARAGNADRTEATSGSREMAAKCANLLAARGTAAAVQEAVIASGRAQQPTGHTPDANGRGGPV